MKILLLNGSPKGEKSNSLHLAKAFCDGIIEQTNAEIEIVPVYKLNIHDCVGYFHCWRQTPGKCVFDDDMGQIIDKIINSDIIVWSFPLYYFSVPSKLKALIDRQLPMNLPFMSQNTDSGGHPSRYDMSNKRYVVISTCGFFTSKGNYSAVNEMFNRMYDNNYTSIYCGQGELFNIKELQGRTGEYLTYVKQAGREFVTGKISDETKQNLDELLFPREIYEQMADASWGIEKNKKSENSDSTKDESYTFTKQMSLLYNKSAWKDKDIVLEFYYTDVDKRYQLLMKKDGIEVIDKDFVKFDTQIETPFSVWQKIGSGELDGQTALMDRLYKVNGDFGVMMNWDNYFGYQSKSNTSKSDDKKTNMNIMLIPWIAIWVGLSINAKIGGIIGILICGLIQFAYLKYKPTLVEHFSFVIVSGICLLAILGFNMIIILPVSYLLFGLMWLGTLFTKTSLTAYYSISDFQDKKLAENPLFIRTNNVITMYWGVLYILTPIWTYFLMLSPVGAWIGLINSILPAILGVFTNWFKTWYPKKYATGR